ncbi:hypothetical protein FQA39_LY05009 [Lamprigera yunnana]|nr:hypothetical protein FQA39_LY05009 [Lamprigera yunnana]
MLDEKWEGLKNIPGIESKNFLQCREDNSISVAGTSQSHLKTTLVFKPATENKSDWDDEDLEPFASLSSLCLDVSVFLVSDQKESSIPRRTKLCVSDIFSDSDDESFDLDLEPVRLPADALKLVLLLMPHQQIFALVYVQFKDIIVKLKAPEEKNDGNNIVIEFLENIEEVFNSSDKEVN